MADLPVTAASYPTPEEVHAQLLSDLRYAYGRLGVTVNVARDSDLWWRCWVVAQRVSLAIANGRIGLQNTNPVTATGDALTQWAAVFGVFPRPAASARGYAAVSVLAPATTVGIPAGHQCTAPDGIKYQTTGPYVLADGGLVQLEAVGTGTGTDQDAGAILTWDSAAIAFLGTKAIVASGGLDGGKDADDRETLRARLLRKLSFPAVGGNWAHVAELAEAASAAVEVAFVYSAARGPSSYDVAVMGGPDDAVLNAATVDLVASAIVAEMPGSESLNCTTIGVQLVDVVINLDVPLPRHAGGAGGGWYDAEPWPSTNEAAGTFARITGVDVAAGRITVDSTVADIPVVGKRFSIWNPTDQAMVDYAIKTVTGGAGAYNVFIDSTYSQNLSFVVAGMYCSASCQRLQDYAASFAAAMATMGPGEKTTNQDILVYARRRPTIDVGYPWALTSAILTLLQGENAEISDISYAARRDSGLLTTRTTPSVPSTPAGQPRRLSLAYLSFRRQA